MSPELETPTPADFRLLLRVTGWVRFVRDDELAAMERLELAGLVVLVERADFTVWAEATGAALRLRDPLAEHRNMNKTMGGFFGRGGANVRRPADDYGVDRGGG